MKNNKNKTEEEIKSAVITNLADPVIVIDNEQLIILANPAARQILGISAESIGTRVEKSLHEMNHSLERLQLCDFKNVIKVPYYSKLLESDDKYPIVEEIVVGGAKDKKIISEGIKIFKVLTSEVRGDDGEIFGYMKIFHDITREKIVDEMKSEFVSIAAHQLRTPSSAVKWVLGMILDGEMGEIPDEAREYIKKALEANNQMVELVRELLDVAHIESGRFVYRYSKIDFEELMDNLIKSSDTIAKQSNVEIIFAKSTKKIPPINVDVEKVKIAIQNLVNNAIKYSKPGNKVEVDLRYGEKDENNIYVSIKDYGIGIGDKDRVNLFAKFYRGENALKLKTSGTGLGLFISKKVLESHGGKIRFESVPEKGTIFYVEIPVERPGDC